MRRVAIIIFELGAVRKKFNLKILHDYFFFICLIATVLHVNRIEVIHEKPTFKWSCIIFSNSYGIYKEYPLHLNTRI